MRECTPRSALTFLSRVALGFSRSLQPQPQDFSRKEHLELRVVFPLSPGSPRGGNPRKMGRNYKIPPPGPAEKVPKNYKKKVFSEYLFGIFSVIFPHFRGLDRGGEFCNFSPFFGDFRAGGFRGSVREIRRKQSSAKISEISRTTIKTSKSDIFYLLRNLLKYLLRTFFSSAKFSEVFTLCVFTLWLFPI